ncbi:MAG: histidine phosphotransferase family protein [Kiloniellaceae bacterium]
MDLKIDVRVAELLTSRLCHDLVGPIGAVGNGLELLAEDEFGMAEDAMKLTANSARQASNVLQFFRLAYGMAGARVGADYSQIRDLSAALLETSRTRLEWTAVQAPDGAPDGIAKLVLNMIALGHEALPRGGTLTVEINAAAGGIDAVVTARGQDSHLRPESLAGLHDNVDVGELTPRGVHGYFTKLMAQRLGSTLEIETPGEDVLQFRATVAPEG